MYTVVSTKLYDRQFSKLTLDTMRIVKNKATILSENPFHYPALHHDLHLRKIRFSDRRAGKRLIYIVEKNIVTLLFILDRKNEYTDLQKHLEMAGF